MPDVEFVQRPRWSLELWNLTAGGVVEEISLNQWQDFGITWNFQGVNVSLTFPGRANDLRHMRPLTSDVVFFRGSQKMFRMKVVDVEERLTREAHTVTLQLTSYEHLLARRVMRNAAGDAVGIDTSMDQHQWPKWLIDNAQRVETLGIVTASVQPLGKTRTRTIRQGSSVYDAIVEVATMQDGFDWWIDADLNLNVQTPRRESRPDIDLMYGANVAAMTRSVPWENYASDVFGIGSTEEVTLPSGNTYPPPPPVWASAPTRPYGRWEQVFSDSDVVTPQSLAEKTAYQLGQANGMRPEYRMEMEAWAWLPAITPGAVLRLLVSADPLVVRGMVRVEEVSISVTVNGDEQVSLGCRSDEDEYGNPAVPRTGYSSTAARIDPFDSWAANLRAMSLAVQKAART